jgi:hypothetical protein
MPGFPKCAEGTCGHLPGNWQIGGMDEREDQHPGLKAPGTEKSIGNIFQALLPSDDNIQGSHSNALFNEDRDLSLFHP